MVQYKIIIDTNLWISLLIGKRISEMYTLCNSDAIVVYMCDELKNEFIRIATSEKIRKYTSAERVTQTLELMSSSCSYGSIEKCASSSSLRDIDDLYLLSFAETIQADFILTGDKDLLSLQSHHQTKIVTYTEFKIITDK